MKGPTLSLSDEGAYASFWRRGAYASLWWRGLLFSLMKGPTLLSDEGAYSSLWWRGLLLSNEGAYASLWRRALLFSLVKAYASLWQRAYASFWRRAYASFWRRANARNVRLYYSYRLYTNLFIFRFVSELRFWVSQLCIDVISPWRRTFMWKISHLPWGRRVILGSYIGSS